MARVALIGDNSIEYIDKLIDIWNKGDCAVLIDWRIPFNTAIEMMKEANVKKCYIDKKHIENFEEIAKNDTNINFFENHTNGPMILPTEIYNKFKNNYSLEEAVIIYSSGTTGKSKGTILSHYAINTNADSIIDYISPKSNDCMYIIKSISHSSALTGELLLCLKTKTKLIVSPTIVLPRITLKNLSDFNVTIISINPTLLNLYVDEYKMYQNKYDLSSLREIYVQGAKTPYKCCELAKKTFNNINIYYEYGLTEAGPRVATQKLGFKNIDSVGKPIKGVNVKIIKEDGIEAEKNEIGIIHVCTASRYLKYVSGENKFNSLYDNWLNTGDVGYINEYGELHIVNRIDDVINLDAHKIYPSDIENKILALSTDIKECVVFGVIHGKRTTIVCIYKSTKEEDVIRIKRQLKEILLPYEIPKIFVRCHNLPKSNNGKISRKDAIAYFKKIENESESYTGG